MDLYGRMQSGKSLPRNEKLKGYLKRETVSRVREGKREGIYTSDWIFPCHLPLFWKRFYSFTLCSYLQRELNCRLWAAFFITILLHVYNIYCFSLIMFMLLLFHILNARNLLQTQEKCRYELCLLAVVVGHGGIFFSNKFVMDNMLNIILVMMVFHLQHILSDQKTT